MKLITLRFYGMLDRLKCRITEGPEFALPLTTRRSVKDLIESEGIPHTEIGLILVNSDPVGFDYMVNVGDRVSVFPGFCSIPLDFRSREQGYREVPTALIADVHLGKLARRLRLLGLDCIYQNNLQDPEIAEISDRHQRTVLTRDRGLLMRNRVVWGILIQSSDTEAQVLEVLDRLPHSAPLAPYSRCLDCNGLLDDVPEDEVWQSLPPATRRRITSCKKCQVCGKVYWQGSHWRFLENWVEKITGRLDITREWDRIRGQASIV